MFQTGLDDDALMEKASRGDRAALEVLLERHAVTAAAHACAILKNKEDALDATQVAMLQLAQNITAARVNQPFKACLYVAVHNAAVDQLRQEISRGRRERTVLQQRSREVEMPGDHAEKVESLAALREEMRALPPETAAVLALHHLENLPVAEVATQTGLSVDACKHRLNRGREQLRERLERRGVALASLVLVMELLNEMFRPARAWAAEIEPEELLRITRNALAMASAATEAASSPRGSESRAPESTNSGTIRPSVQSSRTSILAELRPARTMEGRSKGGKYLLLAGAGIAALLFLGLAINTRKAANGPGPTMGSNGTAKGAETKGAAAEKPAQVNAGSRGLQKWQTPRYLMQGSCSPRAIAVVGEHVALIGREFGDPRNGLKSVLFTSSDSGQTWTDATKISEALADVVVDESGNCAFVVENSEPGARYMRSYQWLSRSQAGQLGKPEIIWDFSTDEFGAQAQAVHTNTGNWVFADQGRSKIFKGNNGPDAAGFAREKIIVAFGAERACPKQVAEIGLPGEMGLAAWAKDASYAGFLTTQDQWQTVMHYVTRDGGKSWDKKPVPLHLSPDSTGISEQAIPLLVKRDGEHLALVIECKFTRKKDSEDPKDTFYQHFLLTSRDLGESWSTPAPVTKIQPEFPDDAVSGLHIAGESVFVAVVIPNEKRERYEVKPDQNGVFLGKTSEIPAGDSTITSNGGEWNSHTTKLLVSSDFGKTFFDHHAFEALGKMTSVAIAAGTTSAIHVALFNEPNPIEVKLSGGGNEFKHAAEQYLVVRSYSSGEWQAPQTPPPASFKETKLPDPTQEEF